MRNLFITICLILLSQTTVFSQYLVVENKIWSSLSIPSEGNFYKIYHTKFEGDTSLNSKMYKKEWSSSSSNPYHWVPNGFYREEEGKVYRYRAGNPEILMYDFTLKEGDLFYYRNWDPYTVDSVRIKKLQGKMLKHIYLSYMIWPDVWIEGIGSLADIFNPFKGTLVGGSIDLLCVKEKGKIFYQNPKFNSCDTYTAVNETLLAERFISLYENGSGDICILQNNGSKGTIAFISPNGKQVLKTVITQPETTLCAPTTGLLLYRFVNTTGEVQTGKVVVK